MDEVDEDLKLWSDLVAIFGYDDGPETANAVDAIPSTYAEYEETPIKTIEQSRHTNTNSELLMNCPITNMGGELNRSAQSGGMLEYSIPFTMLSNGGPSSKPTDAVDEVGLSTSRSLPAYGWTDASPQESSGSSNQWPIHCVTSNFPRANLGSADLAAHSDRATALRQRDAQCVHHHSHHNGTSLCYHSESCSLPACAIGSDLLAVGSNDTRALPSSELIVVPTAFEPFSASRPTDSRMYTPSSGSMCVDYSGAMDCNVPLMHEQHGFRRVTHIERDKCDSEGFKPFPLATAVHGTKVPASIPLHGPQGTTSQSAAIVREGMGSKVTPMAPMNAYNYFFRDERWNILQWKGDGLPPPVSDWTPDAQRRLLFERWYVDPAKGRRLHRKTKGKLGFNELSAVIARRWRDLPETGRQFYKAVAQIDKQRYKDETKTK